MTRNRFAQPLYGKIIYIYETDLELNQLSTVFDPSTYWIDITGIDCEVGYILEYAEGGGLRFVPPPNYDPLTLEEEKSNKVALLKAERDSRETANIEYRDIVLDFDEVSRERMDRARKYIEDNGTPYILWTCADNSRAVLTLEDFKNINTLAAQRSTQLHDQYNLLKDYIDTIETSEELELITFDTEVPDLDEIIEETYTEEELVDDIDPENFFNDPALGDETENIGPTDPVEVVIDENEQTTENSEIEEDNEEIIEELEESI